MPGIQSGSASSRPLQGSAAAAMASASGSSDVVRIAVTNAVSSASSSSSGQTLNHLMQLPSGRSLASVVEELCRLWRLDGRPEDYALRLEPSKEYATERNRGGALRDGTVLKLCQSPGRVLGDIVRLLDSNSEGGGNPQMRLEAHKSLARLAQDAAVAEEMVRTDVFFRRVVKGVVDMGGGGNSPTEQQVSAQSLSLLLSAFHEVMSHEEELVSWEDDRVAGDSAFVSRVASCADPERMPRLLASDAKTHAVCLSILESLALSPGGRGREAAERSVSVPGLLSLLQAPDSPQEVRRRSLALFNALFRSGDRARRRKMKEAMEERGTRRFLLDGVIKRTLDEETRHQLYVLQSLLLNLLEERMRTAVKSEDQKALEKIKELRKLAFEIRDASGGASSHHSGGGGRKFGQDYKRLGFTNEVDPTQDFRKETPPGMLALDLMYAFACHHTDQYTKLVLENSAAAGGSNDCPFARTSIEVARLLCDVLRIGHPPLEAPTASGGAHFLPMFFASDNPLEEMFSVTIQHVARTWREMRATAEDFSKVVDVAREQVAGALQGAPVAMEEYRKALKTYNEISEARKEEAKNKGEREGKAVQHLRRSLTPEIMELIQRQRLNFLSRGTRFGKMKRDGGGGGKDRGKQIFVRLGPSQKTLHYGEWTQQQQQQQGGDPPAAEHLPHKLPISELRDLLTGPQCLGGQARDSAGRGGGGGGGAGGLKGNRGGYGAGGERGSVEAVSLSLVRETGETLDLVAPDPKAFDYWCDGLNALLRRDMRSPRAAEELDALLAMEVKIRLLDVEGVDIPDEPPPIPPLPPNFDFCMEAA